MDVSQPSAFVSVHLILYAYFLVLAGGKFESPAHATPSLFYCKHHGFDPWVQRYLSRCTDRFITVISKCHAYFLYFRDGRESSLTSCAKHLNASCSFFYYSTSSRTKDSERSFLVTFNNLSRPCSWCGCDWGSFLWNEPLICMRVVLVSIL